MSTFQMRGVSRAAGPRSHIVIQSQSPSHVVRQSVTCLVARPLYYARHCHAQSQLNIHNLDFVLFELNNKITWTL